MQFYSKCVVEQNQDNYLHFIFQATLTTGEDHAISDRKMIRQRCTTSDQHGVDTIQILVAEKIILLPMFLDIVWKKKEFEFSDFGL